jgi:hypothetical protein
MQRMNQWYQNGMLATLLLVYAVLGCMAIYFFKERLCTDTGYYFFKTINEKSFHVEHQRFVHLFAEMPVWLGQLLHLPLHIIAKAYSLMHVFFFFSIGAILFWRYRNIYDWLLLLFLQLIGIQYGFLNPVVEQYYGTAICVMIMAVLRQHATISNKHFLIIIIAAFFVLSSHPINLVLFVFVLWLDFLQRKNKRLLFSFLMIIPVFLVYKSQVTSAYEAGKIAWMLDFAHNHSYKQLATKQHWISFAQLLWQHYLPWICLALITCVYFIIQKKLLKLASIVSFIMVLFFVIHLSNPIVLYSGYNEQVCYIIVPIICIPFFMDVLPIMPLQKVMFGVLIVIAAHCIRQQYNIMQVYKAKTVFIENSINKAQQLPGDKFTMQEHEFASVAPLINWDIPFFSMMMASINQQKCVTILPLMNDNVQMLQALKTDDYIFRDQELGNLRTLNKMYFPLSNNNTYQAWPK